MNKNKAFKRQFKNLTNPSKRIKRINILTLNEMSSTNDFLSIMDSIGGLDTIAPHYHDIFYFKGLESSEVYRFVFEDFRGELKQYDSKGIVFQEPDFKKRRGSIMELERLSPVQIFYSDGTNEYGFAFIRRELPNRDALKPRLVSYYRLAGIIKNGGDVKYGVCTDTPMWVLKYLPRFNEKMLDAFVNQKSSQYKLNPERYGECGAICGAVDNLCRSEKYVDIVYSIPPHTKVKKKITWSYPSLPLSWSNINNNNYWVEKDETYEDNHGISIKAIVDEKIDVYSYFKSIYIKDDSEVKVCGIIPMSSLYSIIKVNRWNDTETEMWNNLDQTLKGKF